MAPDSSNDILLGEICEIRGELTAARARIEQLIVERDGLLQANDAWLDANERLAGQVADVAADRKALSASVEAYQVGIAELREQLAQRDRELHLANSELGSLRVHVELLSQAVDRNADDSQAAQDAVAWQAMDRAIRDAGQAEKPVVIIEVSSPTETAVETAVLVTPPSLDVAPIPARADVPIEAAARELLKRADSGGKYPAWVNDEIRTMFAANVKWVDMAKRLAERGISMSGSNIQARAAHMGLKASDRAPTKTPPPVQVSFFSQADDDLIRSTWIKGGTPETIRLALATAGSSFDNAAIGRRAYRLGLRASDRMPAAAQEPIVTETTADVAQDVAPVAVPAPVVVRLPAVVAQPDPRPPVTGLSRPAEAHGELILDLAEQHLSPDEIAAEINARANPNDRINAALVRKVLVEMRARKKGAA